LRKILPLYEMRKCRWRFCIVFVFIAISVDVGTAAKPVTAEQLQQNAVAIRNIVSEFTQASAHFRLLLEYRGDLEGQESKDKLLEISRTASTKLGEIYLLQQGVCKQIEESTDKKWDERYGQTGLWRKASADVLQSKLYKAQLSYFTAAGSGTEKRTQILHNTIMVCQSLGSNGDLLKGRCQQFLSNDDATYKIHAINTLGNILARSDTAEGVYLAASITRLRLSEKCDSKQIQKLAKAIGTSSLRDDFELNLKLAFLQIASCRQSQLLEEVIAKFPDAALFTGRIILADIAAHRSRSRLIAKSQFEIELAIRSVINNGPAQYTELLEWLCNDNGLGGRLLYYALAQACRQTRPKDAVEYYLKAARQSASEMLEVSRIEIAKLAAQLAYQIYCDDQAYCNAALEALEYYHQLASAGADEEMLWFYAAVLYDYGNETKAVQILKGIAGANGAFSREAKLDLTIHKIRRDQIRTDIQLIEAVEILADDFSENQQGDCYKSSGGLMVLANVTERIERCMSILQDGDDFAARLDRLAEFCLGCAPAEFADETKLLRIEAGIIAAGDDRKKLTELNRMLEGSFAGIDSIELVRVRARMAQAMGDFLAATKAWGRVCSILKPANGTEPAEQWWQGKFSQLYCWSKLKKTRPEEVRHAIEVLQSSYNIPDFWAGQIAGIQKQGTSAK
jgi:hypothetical protein